MTHEDIGAAMMRVPGIAAMFADLQMDAARTSTTGLGLARHTKWTAEDQWLIGYTTERIEGGRFDGKYAYFAYKPTGRGSQSGNAREWKLVKYVKAATRKRAKAEAIKLYARHSPIWAARRDMEPS